MDKVIAVGRSEPLFGSEAWGFESLRARATDSHRHLTQNPASTGRATPVIHFAWLDTRNATASEMSSGSRMSIGMAFCMAELELSPALGSLHRQRHHGFVHRHGGLDTRRVPCIATSPIPKCPPCRGRPKTSVVRPGLIKCRWRSDGDARCWRRNPLALPGCHNGRLPAGCGPVGLAAEAHELLDLPLQTRQRRR